MWVTSSMVIVWDSPIDLKLVQGVIRESGKITVIVAIFLQSILSSIMYWGATKVSLGVRNMQLKTPFFSYYAPRHPRANPHTDEGRGLCYESF